MLQDKKRDLESEKQKKLLQRLVEELGGLNTDLYYQSTTEVARQLRDYIKSEAKLNADEHGLLDHLSQRDIEILLSLH